MRLIDFMIYFFPFEEKGQNFFDLKEIQPIFPELFLGLCLMFLLFYGILIASNAEKKFPLIIESISNLVILVLVLNFLMLISPEATSNITYYNSTIIFDAFSCNAKKLINLLGILCFLIIKQYLVSQRINTFEYLLISLFSIFGLLLLCSANDFITAFLCIEIQGLAFYLLAAYKQNSIFATEAGLKYFILGAFSSSMFLFGCSLIYGCSGTLNFEDFKDLYGQTMFEYQHSPEYNLIFLGLSFVAISLMFKLSLAPFHIWSPDIYENSLTSSTVIFAVLPKLSLILFLYRLFHYAFSGFFITYKSIFVLIGLLSVLVGSFVGLEVRKMKALLAYSSISHMGYVILAFSTNSLEGLQAIINYLFIYLFSSICLWAIFIATKIKTTKVRPINKDISDFSTISKTNKILSATLSIALLSLAGFPPLIGFFVKLNVFLSLIQSTLYFSASLAILCSVVSTFYYIRVIKIIYFENKLVGHLYYPINYSTGLIIAASLFLFFILFTNPNILYLYTTKICLLNNF